MVTTQSADNALKSYYLDVLTDTLDKTANPFLAAIRKTTSDVWGRDVRKLVRVGINGGIGACAETGDLPTSTDTRYEQLVSTLKNLYGQIFISDKAIRASQNNEGAFVNLLNDEMDSLVKSSSFNFGRMLFGDGSGVLATVETAASTGVLAVFDTLQNLSEGMCVDIYSAAKTSRTSGQVIRALDRKNRNVIFDSNFMFSKGDYLVVQGSHNRELTGLKAIFSETGTLYGLDKSQNSWLVPHIVKEVGEISESVVQKAIDAIEESYGGKINLIICSMGVRRAMMNKLAAYRSLEPIKLESGYTAFTFGGVPVVADRFCPAGTAYLLNTDDFALHQLCDWQWLEDQGGRVLRQYPNKAVFEGTLVKYAELMCYRPCGQAMLSGITEE